MTTPAERARRSLLWVLLVVGVQNVAYTILIPLTPHLRTDFGMSGLLIGTAFAGFTATKAASQPFGGWLTDRVGPRAVGAAGLALSAACTLALSSAHTTSAVIAWRLFWGVGEGLAIPALLVLATELGGRSSVGTDKAIGWFGSAAVAGMAVGPLLVTPFSGAHAFSHAFLAGGLVSWLSVGLFMFHGRDQTTSPAADRAASPDTSHHSMASPRAQIPSLAIPILIGGLGWLDFSNNFIYAGLEPNFADFGASTGAGPGSVSIVLFLGLLWFAASAPAAGAAMKKVPATRLLVAAFSAQLICLSLPLAASTAAIYVAAFLPLMAAQSVVYVSVRSMLAELPRNRLGRAFGFFGLISDLGWVLGPIVASGLLGNARHDLLILWTVLAGAAVLVSVALPGCPSTRRTKKQEATSSSWY